ncbi:unnamed protein product [Callosobruchus maculatus]|uniref:Reverse transcriptase domain-containing protein n=1 Tax=Callosobruchus maculatus TaxID=64391 RepID=A0A653BT59_CALMS|nr:unnamed protein product [Callosobruchus maculatus]
MSILLRFRKHSYVISADITKMYRQVLVDPEQRKLQKILWRSSPDEELKAYELNTVTYGQASASYLAIRCLFELASECDESNPEIAEIIRHDFYVDDLLTGTSSIEHAKAICNEIADILKSGCFELRKWYSNKPEILESFRGSDVSCKVLEFAPNEQAKTLGLNWSCQNDALVYNVGKIEIPHRCSKRTVLSITSRIFDPLGLLSPCIVISKIFMQKLWSTKLSWDDELPHPFRVEWDRFVNDLPSINALEIRRQVIGDDSIRIELHGFADSSEKAYGACLYVRSTDKNDQVSVHLLCAKSKVAPVKTLTIPKLELCAALLLARLVSKAIESFKLTFSQCILWSDSTITLAWLKTSPNLLKVFVSNRVAEIQALTEHCDWRYVPTRENPADLVSRGLYPHEISSSDMWWHGPAFLNSPETEWPTSPSKVSHVPELKPPQISSLPSVDEIEHFDFERFSSFQRLQRATAYILRFKDNYLRQKDERNIGPLLVPELRSALTHLIKAAQRQSFPCEITEITELGSLKSKSKISNLNPFIDKLGILRVGGRLRDSTFSYDKKYPIILHAKHNFTKLLFEYKHRMLMHPGPQLLLASIREFLVAIWLGPSAKNV